MRNDIMNVGSVPIYRGRYMEQSNYYYGNMVTMCCCLFSCKANKASDVPPLVRTSGEIETYAFANDSVWTCIMDNLALYNKATEAIDAIDRAEEVTEKMLHDWEEYTKRLDEAERRVTNIANHPTIVSDDYYVMLWDYDLQEYVKTDIYLRGKDLNWAEMNDEERQELADRVMLDRIGEPDIEEIIGKVGENNEPYECECQGLEEDEIMSVIDPTYNMKTVVDSQGVVLLTSDGYEILITE